MSPCPHYDEPEILPYENTSICPKDADVRHWEPFFINAPAVVLRDKASARTLALPVFDGLLGAFGASTPWRSRPLDVPPGTYEVRLRAETVGRVWGLSDHGGLWDFGSRPRMNVLLTDSYWVLGRF